MANYKNVLLRRSLKSLAADATSFVIVEVVVSEVVVVECSR
jgi:hypothetical protein